MADFRELPDLALRSLGGAVVYANDEAFAAKENLITPGRPVFDPAAFGSQGKVYDGWETRRRREPGHDEAVVRLGAPGVVHGVVVDTAWFTGNYPPEVAVDGARADGPVVDPTSLPWEELVPRSPVAGDSENAFAVDHPRPVTHVRLRIFPDGGVARLRVHGEALPDPELLDALGTVDLAALEHGGRVVACSNAFYGSPNNLLLPGPARSMGEGWENARRRDDGNDWVEVALVAEARLVLAELDTSWFLHNAPGWAALHGRTADGAEVELLPRTALQPDTRHRFRVPDTPVAQVRMDVYPDGGMARLRLHGRLTEAGRADLATRWSRP
ncbi:MAG TPA: allantoicase [Pseudonocardia sp.]|jgi:allantoicase|uniref:allantoicase n=1 Tax=Pseudonocardia sp. TaxID=60912 RepID=UPI002B4B3761|nr:allantoicase [Pseudonocardia sp.]HLU59920.1 allantoicase [Pseudonocardia sp.]